MFTTSLLSVEFKIRQQYKKDWLNLNNITSLKWQNLVIMGSLNWQKYCFLLTISFHDISSDKQNLFFETLNTVVSQRLVLEEKLFISLRKCIKFDTQVFVGQFQRENFVKFSS